MSLESLDALAAVDAEEVQAALGETALLLDRARARIAGAAPEPAPSRSLAEQIFSLLDWASTAPSCSSSQRKPAGWTRCFPATAA